MKIEEGMIEGAVSSAVRFSCRPIELADRVAIVSALAPTLSTSVRIYRPLGKKPRKVMVQLFKAKCACFALTYC